MYKNNRILVSQVDGHELSELHYVNDVTLRAEYGVPVLDVPIPEPKKTLHVTEENILCYLEPILDENGYGVVDEEGIPLYNKIPLYAQDLSTPLNIEIVTDGNRFAADYTNALIPHAYRWEGFGTGLTVYAFDFDGNLKTFKTLDGYPS